MRGRPATGFGHYLRDMVYGANDGIVTTLAVVAGVSGANFAPIVAIVLGIANLAADGISMGASNYLGLKSELEQTGRSTSREMPIRHAGATFAAFVVAGAVPLLAYLLPLPVGVSRFAEAAILSAIALAVVGALRRPFVDRPTWALSIEMLGVGGLAAAAAYGVGLLIGRWLA